MIVATQSNFYDLVDGLAREDSIAFDTETNGLRWYAGDRLFSIAIADAHEEYYFNFHTNEDIPAENILPRERIADFSEVFQAKGEAIGHNIKFDMHMLADEGVVIARDLWCTQSMSRVEYNAHMNYSLDQVAARVGLEKFDAVVKWMDDNKAYEMVKDEGKKQAKKNYHFYKVPFDIIAPYACQDARVAFQLRGLQGKRFDELDAINIGAPSLVELARNERKFTNVAYDMERAGIRIDRKYCTDALQFERERALRAEREFLAATGSRFVDSTKELKPTLIAAGVKPGKTEKGGDSYRAEILELYPENPIVKLILEHRDAKKRANTYFANFLKYADRDDRVHFNFKQDGTGTGRASVAEPNLQNVSTDEDEPEPEDNSPFPVRRSFIADQDCYLVSIDYKQIEYFLMLEYAAEMGVIAQVLGGMDLHQAMADMVGITRQQAKTLNFAILYGAGVDKIASMLGVDYEEAYALKHKYFFRLPRVKNFIRNVTNTAAKRGYIWNYLGRRSHFDNPQFAYKAANYLIQGSAADVMKVAMVQAKDFLQGKKTKILLNIHDEVLLSTPRGEANLIPEIRDIMAKAYKPKHLPLQCSVSYTEKSWSDLIDGVPNA
jgi:DNA polymerase I